MAILMHSARMEHLPTSYQTQVRLRSRPMGLSPHDILIWSITCCCICATLHDLSCHEKAHLMQPKRISSCIAHMLLCMQRCG